MVPHRIIKLTMAKKKKEEKKEVKMQFYHRTNQSLFVTGNAVPQLVS